MNKTGGALSPVIRAISWPWLLLALLPQAGIAMANEPGQPLLQFSAGRAALNNGFEQEAWQLGLDYRWRPFGNWKLTPAAGFLWINGDANFVYAELQRDFQFDSGWLLTPSFAAGLFQDSETLRLGKTLEFRSGLMLAYRFTNQYRLGVGYYHISNGGLGHRNPGTEALQLSLSVPL